MQNYIFLSKKFFSSKLLLASKLFNWFPHEKSALCQNTHNHLFIWSECEWGFTWISMKKTRSWGQKYPLLIDFNKTNVCLNLLWSQNFQNDLLVTHQAISIINYAKLSQIKWKQMDQFGLDIPHLQQWSCIGAINDDVIDIKDLKLCSYLRV